LTSVLRFFGRVLEALHGQWVLADVDTALTLEFLGEVLDNTQVEVFAAEERIAVGRQHLELMLTVDLRDLDDRHIEGSASEVEHGDLLVAALLVHAVRQRCRRRLVDDALDFETGDLAGILGRLAL
jgi:hypothetical protein